VEDVMKRIVVAALAAFTLSACAALTKALPDNRLPSPEYTYGGGGG
jgi:Prokaryotic membrane lipoprotein lipid attachment site